MLRHVAKKGWGTRCHIVAAVLYSVIGGALMFWPAMQEVIPLKFFAFGAVGLNVAGVGLKMLDGDIPDAD
jgi:hypothetical protein